MRSFLLVSAAATAFVCAAFLPRGTAAEETNDGIVQLLAASCSGCHVAGGEQAIPRLAGRQKEELTTLLLDYRADARNGTIMNRLAKGYAESELRALADYFANLED